LALPSATAKSVARDMSVSLRGELTHHTHPIFRHPDGALPERVKILTALSYAVAQGDLNSVKDILKGEHEYLLNDSDYSGNTPLHIAATSSSVSILRYFLLCGASVHLRNRTGRTPLFMAANAGLSEHVLLLRKSGAHLHADERPVAEMQARRRPGIWALAGIGPKSMKERSMADLVEEPRNNQSAQFGRTGAAGSAPS